MSAWLAEGCGFKSRPVHQNINKANLFFYSLMDAFKNELINILKKSTKLKEIALEIPPDSSMGDFAFPCFSLSKQLKKNPVLIAEDLLKKLKPGKYFEKIEAKGPYLNFFINKTFLAESVLFSINKEKENYGIQLPNTCSSKPIDA